VACTSFGLAVVDLSPLDTLAPQLTVQPASTNVLQGQPACLRVEVASGLIPKYQWRFNGINLPGATQPTLCLPHVNAGQAGAYDVVVSNAIDSVTSLVASLTVILPNRPVLAIHLVGSLPHLTVTGDTGSRYAVEFTTSLATTNDWQALTTLMLTNSLQTYMDSTIGISSQRFYRVRLVP
jgi:hypothetical protein